MVTYSNRKLKKVTVDLSKEICHVTQYLVTDFNIKILNDPGNLNYAHDNISNYEICT